MRHYTIIYSTAIPNGTLIDEKNVIKKCCYPQDAEEGLADGEIPTEEVINILKRSYKSCGIYEQVGSQVAEICKQVSNGASINQLIS